MQTVGSVFILSGVFFISFYHQHISLNRTIFLLTTLAFLYAPYYILKKIVIDDGVEPLLVFFWMMLGREFLSFFTPLFFSQVRKKALYAMRHNSFAFLNALIISAFFLAELTGAWAYKSGALSLVAIVGNTQPFMVMILAFICTRIAPTRAPKELLTRQSVQIKVVSFLMVFVGLALLASSQ